MEESPRDDSLAKAVKILAIAVGCLAVVLLAQFGLYVFSFYRSTAFYRGARSSSTSTRGINPSASSSEVQSDTRPFDTLPPEERVKRSSAILLTRHQKDGGRLEAIVVEILKKQPDTALQYAVGDEFVSLSHYQGDQTTFGDGDVVFFVDSPTDFRESMTYRNGRISGLGDMPLETLREMVKGKSITRRPTALPSGSASGGVIPFDSVQSGNLIDLEESTNAEGVSRVFSILRSAVQRIPVWLPEKGEPPLAMSKAIRLGTEAAQAESSERATFVARAIRMQLVSCEEPVENRWYYVIDCVPSQNRGLAMGRSVPVVVLMDGSVITGRIKHG